MVVCPVPAIASPFTTAERALIRYEFMVRFGQAPSLTDGIWLKTWRGGERAGQPKVPPAVASMPARGLVEGRAAARDAGDAHPARSTPSPSPLAPVPRRRRKPGGGARRLIRPPEPAHAEEATFVKPNLPFARLIFGITLWLTAIVFPAVAEDRIALSCFGGIIGGGVVTFIAPNGVVSRYDCAGPGEARCAAPQPLGDDSAAYARWTAALDRAGFKAIEKQSFGNVTCDLTRERGGQVHSVAFNGLPDSSSGLPSAVATVVRELGTWNNRR